MQLKFAATLSLLFLALPLQGEEIFWGQPELIATKTPAKFIQAASAENLGVVVWQEFEAEGADAGLVYLSLRQSMDGVKWENSSRCLGPFPYKGKQVPIFSVVADDARGILIAVITEARTISIFASSDRGRSFREEGRLNALETLVVPALSFSARRELLLLVGYLFVNQNNILENNQGIYYSRSADGRVWSALSPFIRENEKLNQPSLPFHLIHNRKEFVAFQAKSLNSEFQLYWKTSVDGGNTWSPTVPLTEGLGNLEGVAAREIANQRPFLESFRGNIALAWERNAFGRPPQAFALTLDENARLSKERRLSSANTEARYPRPVVYQDALYFIWSEKSGSGADHLYLAAWEEGGAAAGVRDLSPVPGDSHNPQAVIFKDGITLFWQNQLQSTGRLFALGPDRTAPPPNLTAIDFPPSGYGRLSQLRARCDILEDSSGIKEIYIAASRQKNPELKDMRVRTLGARQKSLEEVFPISGEGIWYVSAAVRDGAGNVSPFAQLTFTRDTQPPGKVRFIVPTQDTEGFFPSNTLSLTWEASGAEEIIGFSTRLNWVSDDWNAGSVSAADFPIPAETPAQLLPETSFQNLENGVYAFSVSAFDRAGNRGEPETLVFRLKNYELRTYLATVEARRDEGEKLILTLFGRGFTGVDKIIIDRDGNVPYDYEFDQSGAFRIRSDLVITDIVITDLDEGIYQIGLHHPQRGLYLSGKDVLRMASAQVVKYGPFGEGGSWGPLSVSHSLFSFSLTEVMVALIILSLFILFLLSARKALVYAGEAAGLRRQVHALIEGGELSMPETKKKITALRRRGMGLRFKFTLLISFLVLLIVVIVSLPISLFMIRNQQNTLAENLFKKVEIVLSGIVRGSTDYLLIEKSRTLVGENLEKQYSLLPEEARFGAVTGPRFINPATGELDFFETAQVDLSSLEHIWAAVGGDIDNKTKSGQYTPVESEILDEVSPLVSRLSAEINARARETLGNLGREIDKARSEYDRVKFRTDRESLTTRDRIKEEWDALEKQLKAELEKLSGLPGSVPGFDPLNLDLSVGQYVFYKPLVARLPGYDNYFWGLGRLVVSMDAINKEIQSSRDLLIVEIGIIALVALALGVTGALVLASIIITPLRRLSQGVAVIRDTPDKSLLKDHQIVLRTRDELRELADTVNQMTQGLVKAAVANKELVVGKEVQKMFIPLETDAGGKKRTTGAVANPFVNIFGYYEGAKGVSGDYFDFKQLDDKHYAIIKCDVAGKGVSASLIMVEVATIFLTFFRDWNQQRGGMKIDTLVYRINDLLEERGFKGRFAALTLCLLNSETGACAFCNAGDNLLHIYRARTARVEKLTLNNAPAAGVFPSSMIQAQAGFQQQAVKLEKGDTLFLFTDGIDESKRVFRDASFQPAVCAEPGLKDGESHAGTHAQGSASEDFGLKRFEEIAEALFRRGTFRLIKYHNPSAEEELTFDYSTCTGTAEEAVLALVSAEKVFRVYRDPEAAAEDAAGAKAGGGEHDIVRVDKKIDAFLSRSFNLYKSYFKNRFENPEEPDYVFFSGLKEDEQYDDLTILAVGKK